MENVRQPQIKSIDWLNEGPLAAHVDTFKQYLTERGYLRNSFVNCIGGVAHFAQWIHRRCVDVQRIDESILIEFLDGHLPSCRCIGAVQRHRTSLSAALGHLLVVLRARGVIAPPVVSKTPVNDELGRYGEYMLRVRGLARTTQATALGIVRRFLTSRFGDYAVDITAIRSEHVCHFFSQEAKRYSKPATAGTVVAALRGYFRYRASLGEVVHGLIGALSYPANWQLASLPKTLTTEELDQLIGSLGQPGRSQRRGAAIVRCALDLGLRSGEVARLSLDDIDWRAGTITLRCTKGRREDVLPLPMHHSTIKSLRCYQSARDLSGESTQANAPFFIGTRGRGRGLALGERQVHRVFAALREHLGWRNRGTHHAPRIHDLRHSFVVNRIMRWHVQGIDIDQAMLSLSTYVGHAMVTNTYWYLSAVPELMGLAAERFESFMAQPEAPHA